MPPLYRKASSRVIIVLINPFKFFRKICIRYEFCKNLKKKGYAKSSRQDVIVGAEDITNMMEIMGAWRCAAKIKIFLFTLEYPLSSSSGFR